MTAQPKKINILQIKSYCVVFPDSCTLLSYILEQEEFRQKIDHFLQMIKKGIPCEILPKVNEEIAHKLITTVQDYSYILNNCKQKIENIYRKSINSLPMSKGVASYLEQAFSKIFFEISKKRISEKKKNRELKRVRIIETLVMSDFGDDLESTKSTTLKDFFDQEENYLKNKYKQFCDKQALFITELQADQLEQKDLLETSKNLDNIFLNNCRVKNKDDRELLSQAIGRTYKSNKWGAVVSTDYSDIIQNRMAIDFTTLLIVSDPLYFLYRFDKKLDFTLRPKDKKSIKKFNFQIYLKKLPDIGIV